MGIKERQVEMAKHTTDELDALKASWLTDPCWDIEDTEGFEDDKEELLAFRKEREDLVDKRMHEELDQRAKKMMAETGITDPVTAQYLFTFAEIEKDVKRNAVGEASPFEMSMLELAQAQARATLLLAAQVKRVADVLDWRAGQDEVQKIHS